MNIPQVNVMDDLIRQKDNIPFHLMVEAVERAITSSEGWDKLARAIKNSGNPNARIKCLSILKSIAVKQGSSDKKEQEIFVDLVNSLDQSLNKI